MASVYAIVRKNATGPAGHGEPGQGYYALMEDGVYERGTPAPVFYTEGLAELYMKEHDRYGLFHILELAIGD